VRKERANPQRFLDTLNNVPEAVQAAIHSNVETQRNLTQGLLLPTSRLCVFPALRLCANPIRGVPVNPRSLQESGLRPDQVGRPSLLWARQPDYFFAGNSSFHSPSLTVPTVFSFSVRPGGAVQTVVCLNRTGSALRGTTFT